VKAPDVHITRGADRLFTVLVDEAPFFCIQQDFTGEGATATAETMALPFSAAEMRFGLGRLTQHVRSGHAALLQLSPERLEGLILEGVPFLVRTPLKLATRTLGWTQANVAVKKVAGWMPQRHLQWTVSALGDLLPGKGQETVLPEVVHDWVWSWIQGVEFSADRAGLLACGSLAAACSGLLRLSPAYAAHASTLLRHGARRLLQEEAAADRATAERLRELLRFALSVEYLSYVTEKGE
jgi:hypothetical protein